MRTRKNNTGSDQLSNFRVSNLGAMIVNRMHLWGIYFTRNTLFAFMIAGMALVVSFAAPFMVSRGNLLLLLAVMIVGVFASIFLLRWPYIGIAGIIVASLMIPFSLSTGSATGINAGVMVLLVMIALWVVEMVAKDKKIHLHASRAVSASIVFVIVALIAFGFGRIPLFAAASAPMTAQIGGLMIFVLCSGAFLMVAHKIQSENELKWMTWALFGVGTLYIIGRLIPFINNNYIDTIFVRHGVLGSLFYVWMVAMALSQALFNKDLDRRLRIGLGLVVAGIFYLNIGISRSWASGWMPALVAAIVVIILARPRYGIMMIIAGIVLFAINSQLTSDIVTEGDNTYSLESRLAAWGILADMVKVNPVFGVGMANYHYYTPLYNILGYSNVQFNSHNQYVDIVLQAGVVGLIAFFWFVWEVFLIGWKQKDIAPEGFSRAYVYGVLGGLGGTVFAGLLGDWVVPFIYNIGLEGFRASVLAWMFMGGLLALQQFSKASGGQGLSKGDS